MSQVSHIVDQTVTFPLREGVAGMICLSVLRNTSSYCTRTQILVTGFGQPSVT